jgi:hypothetical protein
MKRNTSHNTSNLPVSQGNNSQRSLFISILTGLLFVLLVTGATTVFAQPLPPDVGHGSANNQAPGTPSAPIGNGAIFLFVMAAAYAGKKVSGSRTELAE